MKPNDQLITRDILALQRTHLANERTFLAYFRTFIVLLSSGVAILRLELLQDIRLLGWVLLAIAPVMLIVGIYRLRYVRRQIHKYYG